MDSDNNPEFSGYIHAIARRKALLFGIDPGNPAVFAAAAGVAGVMTLAGSLLPAWRATRIDPIAATRTE